MNNVPNQVFIPTTAQKLKGKYQNSIVSLYFIVIFTVINIVTVILGSSYYFLFSSTIPYVLVALGMVLCGRIPGPEYVSYQIFDESVFILFVLVALSIVCLYLLSAIFAKQQKVGWLIFALVFFCLDTILMFLYFGFTVDIFIDLAFHVYVIVSLSIGIHSHYKLKKLPPEEQNPPARQQSPETSNEQTEDSPILRPVDLTVKSRILLDATYLNHTIVYRRVKKTNELIIDGNVYAEYTAKLEFDHSLVAHVNGHIFVAGLSFSRSFIAVDGTLLKQKLRWI